MKIEFWATLGLDEDAELKAYGVTDDTHNKCDFLGESKYERVVKFEVELDDERAKRLVMEPVIKVVPTIIEPDDE